MLQPRHRGVTHHELIDDLRNTYRPAGPSLTFSDRFAFVADQFDPSVTDLAEQHQRVLRQLWEDGVPR